MKHLKLIYAFALLGCIAACDDDDDKNEDQNELQDADERFVEKAALSNMTEVDFGNLVATNGGSDLVNSYGEQMVTEHNTAQQELKSSLGDADEDVDWPSQLDAKHQQIKQQLMTLSGHAFDSAYMHSQVMDHQVALTLFDNAIDSAKNEQVKSYFNKYRPHIEEHLERADSILTVLLTQGG
jgi:putative membrane protein